MLSWIFFFILLRHCWAASRQCVQQHSIGKICFHFRKRLCTTLAVSNQQDTNWYLNYKVLQRTMRYDQLTRFRGLTQLFQSISFRVSCRFFRVLACLSRVSCVQFNEMQRHSHTHDYLFRRPNATGTCVRLFSVIFRRKRNTILLLTRLHFGKTDENSKCIMCARRTLNDGENMEQLKK